MSAEYKGFRRKRITSKWKRKSSLFFCYFFY